MSWLGNALVIRPACNEDPGLTISVTPDGVALLQNAGQGLGQQGPQGEVGPTGPQGEKGEKGDPGNDGSPGSAGSTGPTGATGPQGIQGVKGDNGDTGASGDIAAAWPVGSVFTSVVSTNPATLLGFGTWSAFGAGRMIVGLDANDADYDTAEETGGAKTVALTADEMPSHTHLQDAHSHALSDPGHAHTTQRYPSSSGGSSGFTIDTSMSGTLADNTLSTKSATTGISVDNATATNQSTGGGAAHNNVPPYIVCYLWKRTA